MELPQDVEQVCKDIRIKFPDAEIIIEGPTAGGHWWIDMDYKGRVVTAEYGPDKGWGVSLIGHPTKELDVGYGAGHDEGFEGRPEATKHILELMEE